MLFAKNLFIFFIQNTHRYFADTVGSAKKVGIFEGGVAPFELLREVAVETFGSAGGGGTRPLLILRQLQVLHLLCHSNGKVPVESRREREQTKHF